MGDDEQLLTITHAIARAIARRDVRTLSDFLALGFVYRTPDGQSSDSVAFLRGVTEIPGEIVFVNVEHAQVDIVGDTALVTGIQHAQVKMDTKIIDDRRAFADFFVRADDGWRLRVAVDFGASS